MNKWKKIKDFPGYFICEDGRVGSIVKSKNYGTSFRELKPCKNSAGYLVVSLIKNNRKYTRFVHSLTIKAFKPQPKNKQQCRHLDGNPLNNSITNLEWGTHSENMQDKLTHRTDLRGTKHPLAKLTWEKAEEIRKLHKTGRYSQRKLAEMFSVSKSGIGHVIHNRSWVKND